MITQCGNSELGEFLTPLRVAYLLILSLWIFV